MPECTNPCHPSFDYRSAAAYCVTICAHERRCLFGTVRRGRMALNGYGKIVAEEWERSEAMRSYKTNILDGKAGVLNVTPNL